MNFVCSHVWHDARKMMRPSFLFFAVFMSSFLVSIQHVVHQPQIAIDDTWIYLLGGFEYEEFLTMDRLIMWLLLLLPFLIAVVVPMQTEYDGRCRETLYRFSSYRSWYISKVLSGVIICIIILLCELLGVLLGSAVWGASAFRLTIRNAAGFTVSSLPMLIHSAMLFLVYSTMLTQFMMVVHLVTGSTVVAVLAFSFPVVFGIYSSSNIVNSLSPLNHPINWGMLARSNMMHDPGFGLATAYLGLSILALICIALGIYLAKRIPFATRGAKT